MAKPFNRPHLFIRKLPDTSLFTSPKAGGGGIKTKAQDRAKHGAHLKNQYEAELARIEEDETLALRFEFESEPGFDLKFQSLDSERAGIELLAVREVAETTFATVLIPRDRLGHFIKLFEEYLTKTRGKKNNPANKDLVESIANVRRASVRSLWTDPEERFPSGDGPFWWEVWLRRPQGAFERFRAMAQQARLSVSNMPLRFVDRIVLNLQATVVQLSQLLERDELIAELREAKTSTAEFMELTPSEQAAWVKSLLSRIQAPPEDSPSVCILDTGVNRGHALIGLALPASSLLTVDPRWRADDHHGHGTEMAGLALYGDLGPVLMSKGPVALRHHLESVKLFPMPGDTHAPEVYGAVTQEAAARAQLQTPGLVRTFCMAVTSPDGHERGVPSSWSSAVDALAFGTVDGERRLMCISAGNIPRNHFIHYPHRNVTELIRDPGQSWNAITVGAYADRDAVMDPALSGWKPIAPLGGLCPSSPTSVAWNETWPIKPDIVMPGGNAVVDPTGTRCDFTDSLSLLTTYSHPLVRQFTTTGETSAATALAARLAARLHAQYPQLWPETVRALLIHSADWTESMLSHLPQKKPRKSDYARLLRTFGHGVPHEEAALFSANDALTLIAQHEIQPYDAHPHKKGEFVTKDMHLHALPWPEDVLRGLGEIDVELRVTLSYFIEPLPGDRGYNQKQRHRYASHGLRFDLKTATETLDQFKIRINKAAREEKEKATSASDSTSWRFGPDIRSSGSIHSDRWTGPAVDLADKGYLAVYPTIGWWRERPRHERWMMRTRYALVVSIRTPGVDVYTPVAIELGIPITV